MSRKFFKRRFGVDPHKLCTVKEVHEYVGNSPIKPHPRPKKGLPVGLVSTDSVKIKPFPKIKRISRKTLKKLKN